LENKGDLLIFSNPHPYNLMGFEYAEYMQGCVECEYAVEPFIIVIKQKKSFFIPWGIRRPSDAFGIYQFFKR
jgi:hypothetical protein